MKVCRLRAMRLTRKLFAIWCRRRSARAACWIPPANCFRLRIGSYFKVERWHYLSFLKSRETLNMLRSVKAQAVEPEKIEALLYLIQHDLGYQLHRAVQQVKIGLSQHEEEVFRFEDGDVSLEIPVARGEFESWISEELAAIEQSVAALLAKTGIHAKDVDRVFLTGGSSFVPAVRRIFELQFGPHRIRTGDEFTSVARGLALRSAEAQLS